MSVLEVSSCKPNLFTRVICFCYTSRNSKHTFVIADQTKWWWKEPATEFLLYVPEEGTIIQEKSLREKCPYSKFFRSLSSLNTKRYGPEKLRIGHFSQNKYKNLQAVFGANDFSIIHSTFQNKCPKETKRHLLVFSEKEWNLLSHNTKSQYQVKNSNSCLEDTIKACFY